jgi:hypothetical protein
LIYDTQVLLYTAGIVKLLPKPTDLSISGGSTISASLRNFMAY